LQQIPPDLRLATSRPVFGTSFMGGIWLLIGEIWQLVFANRSVSVADNATKSTSTACGFARNLTKRRYSALSGPWQAFSIGPLRGVTVKVKGAMFL